jgi:hypothetical protein
LENPFDDMLAPGHPQNRTEAGALASVWPLR